MPQDERSLEPPYQHTHLFEVVAGFLAAGERYPIVLVSRQRIMAQTQKPQLEGGLELGQVFQMLVRRNIRLNSRASPPLYFWIP